MTDEAFERRRRALVGCDRMLSGQRPQSIGERLARLTGGYDLDAWPDMYGDGPVAVLEERVAGLLGTEATAFFPTGTMAQQVALRIWAEHSGNRAVAMHPLAHPELHERHAYAALTGLRSVWPTRAPRHATAAEIRDCGESFGTLMLELPLRDAGFVLPTWDELTAVVNAARDRGAKIHFDGARLWESTAYLGRPLAEVAGLADSVYVSFYKTLGGISGAMLAGSAGFVAEAVAWRHRYGGQVFQQWPVALAAMVGLDTELPRLSEYVAHARTVAAALADAPGVIVNPAPPHTHQFQVWLPYPAAVLNEAAVRLAEEEKTWLLGGWSDAGTPGSAMTEATIAAPALDWSADDVRRATTAFLDRVREGPTG